MTATAEGSWLRDAIRKYFLEPRIPAHLAKRFLPLSEDGAKRLQNSLVTNFFAGCPPTYLETPLGKQDLADHMIGRLDRDRRTIVAWLDEVEHLDGLNVLEIGCGTGAS